MQSYSDLTPAGKLRRLHNLALAAIAQYDLDRPEIVYHGFDTNLLYRVTSASGERFMLRLAYPGWRTLQDLQSEAMWLEAIRRDTSITAPVIIPAASGQGVLTADLPGIPQTWNVSLMSWVPGRTLGHYLTAANLSKMGALFAALHQHGASWQPPAGFTSRRFEHWLSRGEPNGIVSDPSVATPTAEVAALPAAWRELLESMHRHVESAYAAIDRRDLRVIHCDLWHDNIKLHHGRLHPFDFEDTVWGFRCHDIAMAMLDLLETVGEARYPGLLAAFRRGYTAYLPWPDDPIEPFQAGRLLWKINWMANRLPKRLAGMVEKHVPVFERYLRKGDIILPLER
jgi:Ser/Thr protein kinase RdoA (MazF antagonist)